MGQFDQTILRAIEEFATEGIQVTDQDGNYLFCNQAFTRLTGLDTSERIGKNVLDVQPDGAAAAVLRTGQPVYGHINTSREGVVMISSASPIRDCKGNLIGGISIFQDRTHYLELAQSLKRRQEEVVQLREKLSRLNRPVYRFQDLIGAAPAFRACIRQGMQAAAQGASILLTGESGTGKELFAHAIHGYSPRANGPFVRVNCPAIPAALLESELFGHVKGAFTGATQDRAGKFELAQHGSIFLDEVGDLELGLQAKLLRVLQEREVERLGSARTIALDTRVIAATNQDLKTLVQAGRFRSDLYYRLNVIHIQIPPLRHRREDIPLLLEHFLKKHGGGVISRSVSNEALQCLLEYDWPGNVRELENVAQRLLLFRDGPVVRRGEVLQALGEEPASPDPAPVPSLAQVERETIQKALEHFGTSLRGKQLAAEALGISLSGLYRKLQVYKLSPSPEQP